MFTKKKHVLVEYDRIEGVIDRISSSLSSGGYSDNVVDFHILLVGCPSVFNVRMVQGYQLALLSLTAKGDVVSFHSLPSNKLHREVTDQVQFLTLNDKLNNTKGN